MVEQVAVNHHIEVRFFYSPLIVLSKTINCLLCTVISVGQRTRFVILVSLVRIQQEALNYGEVAELVDALL